VGLESLSNPNLRDVGKGFYNAERYKELITKITDHGIAVMGGFMFGFDHDDRNVFERTAEFVYKTNLIAVQIAILTPFPGTRLYERFESERRIFDHDWSKYDFCNVVFLPGRMTPEELQEGANAIIKELYSYRSISRRLLHLVGTWGLTDTFRYGLPLNLGYRWDLSNQDATNGT
jgi:radical SAM superfamily enzyme YgiQ (UPF0313 family)